MDELLREKLKVAAKFAGKGEYDEALTIYKEVITESLNDFQLFGLLFVALKNTSRIYFIQVNSKYFQEKYQLSKSYMQRANQLCKDKRFSSHNISELVIGTCYRLQEISMALKQESDSKKYYMEAVKMEV